MRIYYAHSKRIYNTKQEKKEKKAIMKKFPGAEIVCPNVDIGEQVSITPYLTELSNCNAVVCSLYQGHVGKGQYDEIEHAISLSIPVFSLQYDFNEVGDVIIDDEEDWKVNYGIILIKK